MITWSNLDTLASYQELQNVERVDLVKAMTGENGAERVKNYSVPMAAGMAYNFGAKAVDENSNRFIQMKHIRSNEIDSIVR